VCDVNDHRWAVLGVLGFSTFGVFVVTACVTSSQRDGRGPRVLWEQRSGREKTGARFALVPDRDGDGVRDVAAVYAIYPGATISDGSCVIYSGANGVELTSRSLRNVQPEQIVWVGSDVHENCVLMAWLAPGEGAKSGFVARLALETGERTRLVELDALEENRLSEDAGEAFFRVGESWLAVVDRTERGRTGRLRIIDLRDGRERLSRTGEELGLAIDGVRTASNDGRFIRWLAMSRTEGKLATFEVTAFDPTTFAVQVKLLANWEVPGLVNAALAPDRGFPTVIAVQDDGEQLETLSRFAGVSGALVWKRQNAEYFTTFGASMDATLGPRGASDWVAVSGPNWWLLSHCEDVPRMKGNAGRIDIFDAFGPERVSTIPPCEELRFLGNRLLWADADEQGTTRILYATAIDSEDGEAVIRAYLVGE
jgi:hypothetical protein